MKNRYFLAALSLLFSLCGLAQSKIDSLPTVYVQTARLPTLAGLNTNSTSVVALAQLDLAKAQINFSTLLDDVPGVFALGDFNYAQDVRVAIRGFGTRAAFGIRGIKILVDGIPESSPDGQGQIDNVDLNIVERVEVTRGLSGAQWGNAAGGLIHLATADLPIGAEEDMQLTVRAAMGSYGFSQVHGLWQKSGTRFSVQQALSLQSWDGYRTQSAMQTTQSHTKLRWQPREKTHFQVLLNATHSPIANDPGSVNEVSVMADPQAANANNIKFDAGEAIQQARLGMQWTETLNERQQWHTQVYATYRDFVNRLPFNNSGQVAFQRWMGGASTRWNLGTLTDTWQWTHGLEWDGQRDNRQRYDNEDGKKGAQQLDQQEEFLNFGAFSMVRWMPRATWVLEAGLRYDRMDIRVGDAWLEDGDQSASKVFHNVSPWLGATHRWAGSWRWHGQLGTAFEAPTLNELSNVPNGLGGFAEGLSPQRTYGVEQGVIWTPTALKSISLTGFYAYAQNELTPFELADQPGRTFYQNAGTVGRYGVEFESVWPLLSNLEWRGNLTWAQYRFVDYAGSEGDFSGNALPILPALLMRGTLEWTPFKGATLLGQAKYMGSMFADNQNTTEIAAVWLFNAQFQYDVSFKKWKAAIWIRVNNLSNKKYYANIRPNAFGGRYFEAGLPVHGQVGVELGF